MSKAKVRIAQIGCGYWGKNLARNFAELGVLAAVVDDNPTTRAAMTAQHGVEARTLDDVLAEPTITGLSFATPAETHAALAGRALAAGKHVYVEKPLALTAAECSILAAQAKSAGRCLMVGHLLQYHPIFRRLCKLVSDDELGPLNYLYSNRLSLGKFRTEEDVLWSFAPHDVSMILALANRPVVEVSAQGASFVTPGIADVATLQLRFEGGLRGHILTSWAHPIKEQRLVVIGSKAMAVFEDSQPDWGKKLAIYRHRIDVSGAIPVPEAASAEYIEVASGEPLREECREFVNAITENRAPRTDASEGMRVIDVLERASLALTL